MQHEKLIKKDNGDRVEIIISVWLDSMKGAVYDVTLRVCEKGKRKFVTVSRDDYEYRGFSMEKRKLVMMEEYHKYVTPAEIWKAKTELWEKLNP